MISKGFLLCIRKKVLDDQSILQFYEFNFGFIQFIEDQLIRF